MQVAEYPPKLLQIGETIFGSRLGLSDRRNVSINVRPDRLNQALLAYGKPTLADFVKDRSLSVYADMWDSTDEDWARISALIIASPVAMASFGKCASIWQEFGKPTSLIRELPQRVYGGLEHALYTLHPFKFRSDPNRPLPWRRCLLSASGGLFFNTWVDLVNAQVEVESGVRENHFLE